MKHSILAATLMPALLAACSPDAPSPPAPDLAANAISPTNTSLANAASPGAPQRPVPPGERAQDFPPITPAGFAGYVVGNPIPMAGPDRPVEQAAISDDCRMFRDKSLPDVWIMTDGKRIVRRFTALGTSPLRTAAGIGIGATEAEVRAAYPGIRKERSDYVMPPGGILFTAAAGQSGLRFDLDEQAKVVEISGGAPPFIGYSEGCA